MLRSRNTLPLTTFSTTASPIGSSIQGRCFGKYNTTARPVSDVAQYSCSGESDECV